MRAPAKTSVELRQELKPGRPTSEGFVAIELKFPRDKFDCLMKAAAVSHHARTAWRPDRGDRMIRGSSV